MYTTNRRSHKFRYVPDFRVCKPLFDLAEVQTTWFEETFQRPIEHWLVSIDTILGLDFVHVSLVTHKFVRDDHWICRSGFGGDSLPHIKIKIGKIP